jgi:hypothetical protein
MAAPFDSDTHGERVSRWAALPQYKTASAATLPAPAPRPVLTAGHEKLRVLLGEHPFPFAQLRVEAILGRKAREGQFHQPRIGPLALQEAVNLRRPLSIEAVAGRGLGGCKYALDNRRVTHVHHARVWRFGG